MIRYDYCSTIPKCAEPEPPTPEPVMTSGNGSIRGSTDQGPDRDQEILKISDKENFKKRTNSLGLVLGTVDQWIPGFILS